MNQARLKIKQGSTLIFKWHHKIIGELRMLPFNILWYQQRPRHHQVNVPGNLLKFTPTVVREL